MKMAMNGKLVDLYFDFVKDTTFAVPISLMTKSMTDL
jgi:hypothetical protein